MRHKVSDRYWTQCKDGQLHQLFRNEKNTLNIERWTGTEWVLCKDAYKRIAWEADYDQIVEGTAERLKLAISRSESLPCDLSDCYPCRNGKRKHQPSMIESPRKVPAETQEIDSTVMYGDLSVLNSSTIAMHEIFLSFLSAGFTEAQALQLISHLLTNSTEKQTE